jgi:hypothetical protein
VPFPEDPIRIQLKDGSKHWRLPRKSDLGGYVIRRVPGKIRRVWVQPCWLGKCSPRRFVKTQEKRDVLRFMKRAIKVQSQENIDFARDFIEKPYFLRHQQLPSGRVTPEVASAWRIEDAIESSKGSGKWCSVRERIKRRQQEGRKLHRKFGKSPIIEEEISYLTVNCDFQEVPAQLSARTRMRSPERGFHFAETTTRYPIEGPKTQKEVQEEEELTQRTSEYMAFLEQHRKHITK